MIDYRDYKKPVTADNLIQQYDLNSIKKSSKKTYQKIENLENGLQSTNTLINNFIDVTYKDDIENLQSQIDGAITTWFFNGVPTLSNQPAVEWTTDEEKANHLGDLYYDQNTGYAYRFAYIDNAYSWSKIVDADVTEALAIANSAKDTADSKRTVFIVQPTPPYEVGDLWTNGTDLKRCIVRRQSGSFNAADWDLATNYTDDSYAQRVEGALNSYKTEVSDTYTTKSEFTTSTNAINANVSALTTRTTTLEGEIVNKADNSRVASLEVDVSGLHTDVTSVTTTANTANTNASTALSTADTANSTATTARREAYNALNTINNLEIGGGNIILRTADWGGIWSDESSITVNGDTISMTSSGNPYYGSAAVKYNETYTIGVDIKANESFTPSGGFILLAFFNSNDERVNAAWFNGPFTTDWVRHTLVFKVPNDSSIVNLKIGFRNNQNKTIYFRHLKVEKGNKPTDWTIAPEDVDYNIASSVGEVSSDLQDYKTTVQDNINTAVDNTLQEVDTKLSDYETVANVQTVKDRVSTLETSTQIYAEFQHTIEENGVTKVDTTTGFKFDESGLSINKSGAKTKTNLDEKALEVKNTSDNKDVLYSGYVDSTKAADNTALSGYVGQSVTYTQNIVCPNFGVFDKCRIQPFVDSSNVTSTGFFWVG